MTTINPDYPFSELTGKFTGRAMEAHNIPGNSFQEVIYQRALAIEMMLKDLEFSQYHTNQ